MSPLTTSSLAAAEELLGLEFTEDERELVLASIELPLRAYAKRRQVELPDGSGPATGFTPVLPGMSFERLDPGTPVLLENLDPDEPRASIELPREVPEAGLEIEPGTLTALDVHLNSVVIRPDLDQVVMTWCASAPVERTYGPNQYDAMRREIRWIEREGESR